MTDTRNDPFGVRTSGVDREVDDVANLRARGLGQAQAAIIRVLARAILDRHRRQDGDSQVGSSRGP